MRRLTVPGFLLCIVSVCVLVAGCGAHASVHIGGDPTLNDPDQTVSDALSKAVGQEPKSVTCPDDVPAENGHEFRCVVTANDGTQFGATVTESDVHDERAHIKVQVDKQPLK